MREMYDREIEQLYLQMHNMLFQYARSSLMNDSLAEEAVQETFQIACLKPEALCTSHNPKGWLVNTLKNVISNTKRKQQSAKHVMMEFILSQGNENIAANDLVSFELNYEDISRSEEFLVLKEMVVDGRSYLEMAQSRGISIEACRKRVQRAKETLRKKIEK